MSESHQFRPTGPSDLSDVSNVSDVSAGVAATSGTYNAVAVALAVIVAAALLYGISLTAVKAAALFTA